MQTVDRTAKALEAQTMSLEELLRALGIGTTAGYQLARENRLPIPAIRVGRQFRFSRRAFDRLMEAGHEEQSGDAA
jgi:excisionase family DNA binding protein